VNKGLVSVITANLNRSEYLERCFNSLNVQTYDKIEHIFVDGLSSDNSLNFAKSLSTRKSIYISEKDSGIYDAFNKGISLAAGEYICFLNTDDWYEPDFLQHAVQSLEMSRADWVFGDNFFHYPNGTLQFIPGDPIYFNEPWKAFSRFHHTTVVFRRSCFDDVGNFPLTIEKRFRGDVSLKICNDYFWFLKAQVAGKTGVYDHRITGHMAYGGVSTTFHSMATKEGYLIAGEVFGFGWKLRKSWYERSQRNSLKSVLTWLYRRTPKKIRTTVRRILQPWLSAKIYQSFIS